MTDEQEKVSEASCPAGDTDRSADSIRLQGK